MLILRPKRWTEKPPVGAQINWGHPLTRRLVGCWLFNERVGSPRNLVNGRADTLSGATWTTGQMGTALSFDGVNDYLSLPSIAAITTAPVTFEFWVTMSGTTPLGLYDSAPDTANVLRAYGNNDGDWEWHFVNPKVSHGLTANQRTHIIIIYWHDGNRHITYYRDGVFQATVDGTTDTTMAWTTLRIGDINSGGAGRYSGLVHGFNLRTARLTAHEAAWLHAEPYVFLLPPSPRIRVFSPSAAVPTYDPANGFAAVAELAGITGMTGRVDV